MHAANLSEILDPRCVIDRDDGTGGGQILVFLAKVTAHRPGKQIRRLHAWMTSDRFSIAATWRGQPPTPRGQSPPQARHYLPETRRTARTRCV